MARHLLITFVLFFFFSVTCCSQDIPLFGQKLTNSMLYNPATAGNGTGSLVYSYRQNYQGVNGAPQDHLLSAQTPISNYRFGTGITVFQEDASLLRTTYISGAFAYHMHFSPKTILSMGVSGEYNTIRSNGYSNTPSAGSDLDYQMLQLGKDNNYDFSFGLHFQTPYLKVGIAANRIESAWIKGAKAASLTSFYSGSVSGIIPARGGEDLFEPYVAFKKFSTTNNTLDVGAFYTYGRKIMLGASVRSKVGPESANQIVAGTVGYYINKNLLLGYSHETMLGSFGSYVGAANEVSLKIDFNNRAYRENFREEFKSAVSYRRKIVTKAGSKNPQQLHKNLKKLKPYTPNNRYQSGHKVSDKNRYNPKNYRRKK